MAGIDELRDTLAQRLQEAAARHGVAGAVVALRQGDTVVEAATGLTNVRTGVEVTTDTVFQIGSITKVWTATLVMQLVDEGLLDLDEPVRTYLPDFVIADADVAASVTARQLLSHTSGMDGDVFDEFGRGDDCIEKYVTGMATLAQTNPPGAFFSYCNSGFVLLGRLIEELRGCTWDQALQKHLSEPLGLTNTVTLADEAILRRAAVGHLPTGEDGALEVAPMWFMTRAMGPAGVITQTAADLLAFAHLHLDDGRAPDGRQVLSPGAVKAMQQLQVELPEPDTLGEGWGLGWILYQLEGPTILGHDGTTIGQQAYLRIVPERDLAVTLLTNGGAAGSLFKDLVGGLLEEQAGASLRTPVTPPEQPVDIDPTPFLGTYERTGVILGIERSDSGGLQLATTATGPLAGMSPDEPPTPLVVLDDTRLITAEKDPRLGGHIVLKFLEPGPDGFGFVHFGARATPRRRSS